MTLAEFSRRGGKAGTGCAKVRKTSFTSRTAKLAARARKAKREKAEAGTAPAQGREPELD